MRGGDPYRPLYALLVDHVPEEAATFPLRAEWTNPHTPLHALLMTPFAMLPFQVARFAWLAVSVILFVVAIGWMASVLGASRATSVAVGAGALALPLVATDLRFGQSNSVLLLVLVGAWVGLRRGNERLAGAALGLVAAMRLFPALMIIPLIRLRKWRAVGWMLGTAVALTGLGTLVVGFDDTWRFVTEVSRSNLGLWAPNPDNISLAALPIRQFAPEDPATGLTVVTSPVMFAVVATMLLLAFAAWRTPARQTGDAYWAAIPWMVAASPLAWEHYAIALIPGAMLAWNRRCHPLLLAGYCVVFLTLGHIVIWLIQANIVDWYKLSARLHFAVPAFILLASGLAEWLPATRRANRAALPHSV
jgi:alpha-1,2-mannosyltransferase